MRVLLAAGVECTGIDRPTGAEEDAFDFDGFGRYIGEFVGAYGTPYRYGGAWGYITDPAGMVQLGARWYWPEIGRFIQQDPIGDGINWYAYVGSNPLVRVDPEGLDWVDDLSNASAGFGDWLSFGLTRRWRQAWGYDDIVDPCSSAYRGGRYGGYGYDVVATVVGVGAVKTAVGRAAAKQAARGGAWESLTHAQKVSKVVRELTGGRVGLELGRAAHPLGEARLIRAGVPAEVASQAARAPVPHLNIGRYHVIANRHNWYKPWRWFVK